MYRYLSPFRIAITLKSNALPILVLTTACDRISPPRSHLKIAHCLSIVQSVYTAGFPRLDGVRLHRHRKAGIGGDCRSSMRHECGHIYFGEQWPVA